jgi:hypothetical protein
VGAAVLPVIEQVTSQATAFMHWSLANVTALLNDFKPEITSTVASLEVGIAVAWLALKISRSRTQKGIQQSGKTLASKLSEDEQLKQLQSSIVQTKSAAEEVLSSVVAAVVSPRYACAAQMISELKDANKAEESLRSLLRSVSYERRGTQSLSFGRPFLLFTGEGASHATHGLARVSLFV